MIEGFLDRLASCRSDRDFFRAHTEAERFLTPLEIHELLDVAGELPPETQAWLHRVTSFTRFCEAPPMRYQRSQLYPNIDLYTDPAVPRSAKRLIIGFCGTAQRLLMPIASMLQFLPSRQCDFLVLRDPTFRHFLAGIAPYADSFWALMRSLANDLGMREYVRLYCYGTCMGGFAALRAGILLHAARAISISGTLGWHVRRLVEEPDKELPAFDPLCDCYRPVETTLVCAYSISHEKDREQARRLSHILPIEHLAATGMSGHNLIEKLAQRNGLGTFYNRIFDLEAEKTPSNAPDAPLMADALIHIPAAPQQSLSPDSRLTGSARSRLGCGWG
jgi:hypothetical protein